MAIAMDTAPKTSKKVVNDKLDQFSVSNKQMARKSSSLSRSSTNRKICRDLIPTPIFGIASIFEHEIIITVINWKSNASDSRPPESYEVCQNGTNC